MQFTRGSASHSLANGAKVPYQVWSGKKEPINLQHFRPFWAPCFIKKLTREVKRSNKASPRGYMGRILGSDPANKSYRVLTPWGVRNRSDVYTVEDMHLVNECVQDTPKYCHPQLRGLLPAHLTEEDDDTEEETIENEGENAEVYDVSDVTCENEDHVDLEDNKHVTDDVEATSGEKTKVRKMTKSRSQILNLMKNS